MTRPPEILCPFDLTVEPIARFLNCELPDDPQYDGLELQWFDDPLHGTGLLAFLSNRADRTVDFYVTPGLRLDPRRFVIGGGPGVWTDTTFEVAHLYVADDGVAAHVVFTDRHGQRIEVHVDDRDGRRRRRGTILAPVGSGTERPLSLLLVHLHGFDLVRRTARARVIRIGERRAHTGALPGRALHRRELIKYAAPLTVITLNEARDGAVAPVDPGAPDGVRSNDDGITGLVRGSGHERVRLALRPPFPHLAAMPDGATAEGAWRVLVEDAPPLTGGTWSVRRRGAEADLEMRVTERWRPGRLPALIGLVTRVVPVFRRWPTTYRWDATVTLGGDGQSGDGTRMTSRWSRIGAAGDDSYRAATQSRRR